MQYRQRLTLAAAYVGASFCAGCAVPHFDVQYSKADQPTAKTIVERIECELRDLVRNGRRDDPLTFHRDFLLNHDYEVEVALSLEVNETGGLSPTLSYMNPLSSMTSAAFGGTATLSESRDHTFTENLQFSVRDIYNDWRTGADLHECPSADTELAGSLGISDFVAMASVSPGLSPPSGASAPTPPAASASASAAAAKGVFGGTIQFLVTKSVSAVGPTWTLTHFKGPGGLVGLSQVNTDKITLSFAEGPNIGIPISSTVPRFRNSNAHEFLEQLLTGGISSQLSIIENSLTPR